MKTIKTFVLVTALSVMSFGAFAQSISTTASTLDRAEAKIAAQAAEEGASYKITSAQFNNRVHMTAELTKYRMVAARRPVYRLRFNSIQPLQGLFCVCRPAPTTTAIKHNVLLHAPMKKPAIAGYLSVVKSRSRAVS